MKFTYLDKIDPSKITNYNRTKLEAEQFIVFCTLVAGKNADQQAEKLHRLLSISFGDSYIKSLHDLVEVPEQGIVAKDFDKWNLPGKMRGLYAHLQDVRMGQYYRITRAIHDLNRLRMNLCDNDIRNATEFGLVQCFGISHKTANYFLLHTKPNHTGIPLDTHILRWARWFDDTIPKTTPSAPYYKEYQEAVLDIMDDEFPAEMTLAEIDLQIWNMMRGGDGLRPSKAKA